MNEDELPDDYPRDELVGYTERLGWRLSVYKSGFWIDTFDFKIRPLDGIQEGDVIDHGGLGFRSVERCKEAAIDRFRMLMREGHIKPRQLTQAAESGATIVQK